MEDEGEEKDTLNEGGSGEPNEEDSDSILDITDDVNERDGMVKGDEGNKKSSAS